jgi:hypothetical protein
MARRSRCVAAFVAGLALLVSGSAFAQGGHVGPAQLYPDPSLTTGMADTKSADDLTKRWDCPSGTPAKSISKKDGKCTYSVAHRDVGSAEHKQVYDEYKVPASARNAQNGEVDHFYPLCAGGSNDIGNLWYQPAQNPWNGANFGYHQKDDLRPDQGRQARSGRRLRSAHGGLGRVLYGCEAGAPERRRAVRGEPRPDRGQRHLRVAPASAVTRARGLEDIARRPGLIARIWMACTVQQDVEGLCGSRGTLSRAAARGRRSVSEGGQGSASIVRRRVGWGGS